MGWEDVKIALDNRKLTFIPIMHLSSYKTNKEVQLSDVYYGGQKENADENTVRTRYT